MLMVRIFYVEKKQICCRQNRAELLACVNVNQDQDVWCFCLQCAMSFSFLFLALVVLIGYLCPLMGLSYVNVFLVLHRKCH